MCVCGEVGGGGDVRSWVPWAGQAWVGWPLHPRTTPPPPPRPPPASPPSPPPPLTLPCARSSSGGAPRCFAWGRPRWRCIPPSGSTCRPSCRLPTLDQRWRHRPRSSTFASRREGWRTSCWRWCGSGDRGGGGESGGLLLTGGHTHSPLSLTHLPIHPPTHPAPPPLQVVDHERPDLQEAATALVRQLAEYTITLNKLEDGLLARLAASQVRTCAQECMRRRRVGVGVGGDAVSRAPNNSRCTASRQRHHHPMTLPRTPPPPSCPLTPGRHPGGSPSDREPGGDQAHRHRDCGARGAGQGGWAGVG